MGRMSVVTGGCRQRVTLCFAIILCLLLIHEMMKVKRSHSVQQQQQPFIGRLITDPSQLPLDSNDKVRCVKAAVSQIDNIIVCTYANDTEDIYISRDFHEGRYFHAPIVNMFMNLLRRSPGTGFVDIGANLGSFTLPAARLTTVVAVEPFRRTMARLAKSVQLNGVEAKVSLVNNALSSRRAVFKLRVLDADNQGGQYLKKNNQTELPCVQNDDPMCVETILLDDLLPLVRSRNIVIKIDAEAHESEVFTESTASRFFSQLNVQLVFTEWINVKERPPTEVLALTSFFSRRNYTARHSDTGAVLTLLPYKDWPWDVVFVHEDFDKRYGYTPVK